MLDLAGEVAKLQGEDGNFGRRDDGRVVRDFKLEPTTREV